MKRIFIMILAVLLLYTAFTEALSEEREWEGISWLHRQYGFSMNREFLDEMHGSFREETFNCGLVQVTLKEILCDGIWMYVTSVAAPTADDVIILPCDADLGDFVSGGYGEEMRDDHRTFLEAAREDRKNLLWIEAMPEEYLNADFCFIDHRQDAEERTTLFSGAPVMTGKDMDVIHYTVKIYLINPDDGKILSSEEYSFPITFPVSVSEEMIYQSLLEDVPFNRITLVKTPLASYAFPNREAEMDYVLLDGNGNEWEPAIPEDTSTLLMDEFPDKIIVRFYADDEAAQDVMFISSGDN